MAQRIAVLLVAVLALAGCVSRTGPAAGSPEGGPPGVVARDLLEHADPCGFLDHKTITDLGKTSFDGGLFYTDCTASIDVQDNTVSIQAQLKIDPSERDDGERWRETERRGFTVWTSDEESYGCEREIEIYDDAVLALWVSETGKTGTTCDIVDKATDAAIDKLTSGEAAQLQVAPGSLANQDACELITEDDAARAPDVDATDLYPGFGGQFCSWGAELVDQPGLFVSFTRGDPPSVHGPTEQPIEVAGHLGIVTQEGPDSTIGPSLPYCEVAVVYHSWQFDMTEILTVSVRNNEAPASNCPLATELTEKALDQLPGG